MIKILNIIGARPQIIKAAAISRAIRNKFGAKIQDTVLHTGQHYDSKMSDIFFEEMQIPLPAYNLNVGSTSHGVQTAAMITGIEEIILKEKPSCCVVYGDTNSTLAAAIAASKLHCPIVHVEAGLRSFNKKMPEEINRIMCDHASTLLFTPTKTGFGNLVREGFNPKSKEPFTMDNPGIFHCGDVMYDNSLFYLKIAEKKSGVLSDNRLQKDNYILVTIHRDSNTDNKKRLAAIFTAIHDISKHNNIPVILPLHPRTSKILKSNLPAKLYSAITNSPLFKIIPPVSFFDMIALEKYSKIILTDSGGVQKESFFFKKPCIVLRSETEWSELVTCGTTIVANADKDKIINGYNYFMEKKGLKFPSIFGDGKAAEFICEKIIDCFGA